MASSRTEYPALLTSLQPEQAVNLLTDRVVSINRLNNDIADWLQERRKIEEAYVQGLRRLPKRPQSDGANVLGIFQMPWERIVSGTENLAASHEMLAQKIESDVETPLRQFASKNRQMQGLTTTQGNLAAIARDIGTAQKRADKLNAKGGSKAAGASSNLEEASQQWETQAPYVFEQLQALDESRVDHLRGVLTQLQTHEVDAVERNRASAESCLNALLNIETADEIKTFAVRAAGGRPSAGRRRSSATAPGRPGSSHLQTPPVPPPPRVTGDSTGQRADSFSGQDRLAPLPDEAPEKKRLGGIKRLSTVLGRKKGAVPPPPPSAAEKAEKRKEKGRSMLPFKRGDSSRSMQSLEATGQDLSPIVSREPPRQTIRNRPSTEPAVAQPSELPPHQQSEDTAPTQPVVNGTSQPIQQSITETPPPPISMQQPGLLDTPQPAQKQQFTTMPDVTQSTAQESGPTRLDSIPASPPRSYPSPVPDADEMSRNFAIRDQPIQEDESEAQKAMNNMANQLRMQAQSSGVNRVQGSVRGRRDVRTSMFVPSATDGGSPSGYHVSNVPGAAMGAVAGAAIGAGTTAAAINTTDAASPIAPRPPPPRTIPEDHAIGSDTTSIHSAQSLATQSQHPELHEPGLSASIVETVNTWFSETGVTKSFVTGEVALAYNPTTSGYQETEEIRLQQFQDLEKVAVNPMYVSATKPGSGALDDQAGSYKISLHTIKRPTPVVGLKYQLHINETNLARYSPVLITPAWQIVEGQTSIIVLYSLNPAFHNNTTPASTDGQSGALTIKNVTISVGLDISSTDSTASAKPTSAMMAPSQGASFKRKAGAVVWRLNELVVKPTQERLLVRFMTTTPGLAKKGSIELKFELPGTSASAIGVERQTAASGGGMPMTPGVNEGSDPFSDEAEQRTASRGWEVVPTRRALVSGRYTAA